MLEDKASRIHQVLEIFKQILPAMQADGGGMELISIKDNIVYVKMKGACLHCPSISLTLKVGIEKTLKERLWWVEGVRHVNDLNNT